MSTSTQLRVGLCAMTALAVACGDGTAGPPTEQVLDPSSLSASADNGEPGEPTAVVVEARDMEGGPFLGPLPGLELEIRGENPGTVTDEVNNGDGSYTLSYTPATAGFDTLIATLDGDVIAGTPLASRVRIVWVAASGSATLDGAISPGEWDGAAEYAVFGGPTLSGSSARFMADATNLYVLVTYPDSISSAAIRFDNTLDLVMSGDDLIGGSLWGFADLVFSEGRYVRDSVAHGSVGAAVTSSSAVFEFSHPLDSGDPQDIDIDQASAVGVCLSAGIGGTAGDISEPGGCIVLIGAQRDYAELKLP